MVHNIAKDDKSGVKIAFVHPALRNYMLELFGELNRKYGITFIFNEHLQYKNEVVAL